MDTEELIGLISIVCIAVLSICLIGSCSRSRVRLVEVEEAGTNQVESVEVSTE